MPAILIRAAIDRRKNKGAQRAPLFCDGVFYIIPDHCSATDYAIACGYCQR